MPESCVLHPEQVVKYPYVDLLPEGLREWICAWEGDEDERDEIDEIEEDSVTYRTDLSIAPGWKAGGFASWHATDPASVVCGCGREVELLLTVASQEWDNGCRTWIPVEDLPTADAMDAGRPTQVTVGRGGDMNFFVCPADAAHPHRLFFQG